MDNTMGSGFRDNTAVEIEFKKNAKYFNKNIKYFVEHDPDLKMKTQYAGIAGINPNVISNSSPRGIMATKQFNQPIVLNNSVPNMVVTKTIHELGKYTISKKIDNNAEVLGIVKRHYDSMTGDAVERTIIYKDMETGIIDAITIPKINRSHPTFGFNFKLPEDIDSLSVGDILPAGKVLADTPAKQEDGAYGLGKDLNVIFMPLPGADEDGVIFSDELKKDLSFNTFNDIVADIDEDEFLINVHGDKDVYKPILELGETIGNDGIVIGTRSCDKSLSPVLLSKKALLDYNPIFDKMYYDKSAGGKIVDIKVYKNNNRKKTLPTGTTDVLDRYYNLTLSYHRQIVDIYNNLNKKHYRLTRDNLAVGNTFNRLVVESLGIVESSKSGSRLKKTHKLTRLKLYRIVITVEHTMELSYGFKNSDESANKGVIGEFMPKEHMPVDKWGNRAQVIMSVDATPSRLNPGRVYERHTKAAMLKVTRLTKEAFETMDGETISELNDDDIRELFKIRYDFILTLDNDLTEAYTRVYEEDDVATMRLVMDDCLNGFRIKSDLADSKGKYNVATDIQLSKYKPDKSEVTYTYMGKTVTTKDELLIAPLYMYLLSKIAGGELLVCASASVNHYGLAVAPSKNQRGRMGYSNNPLKFLGETETRVLSAFADPEFLAELIDIDSSTVSHEEVYGNILKAKEPTNMETHISRKKIPIGNSIPLNILKTLFKSGGINLVYKTSNDIVSDIEDKRNISIMDDTVNIEKIEV